jgi:hypothetical protein
VAVLGQRDVEQPAPQLLGAAVGQRPGQLRDALEPHLGPGAVAPRGGQPLADEDGPDAVLGGDAPPDQVLAGGDQRPPLAHPLGRDGHPGELAQGVQRGQAEGVVPVGLPLGVLELPGLAGGVGDLAGTPSSAPKSLTQPARAQASTTTQAGRWRWTRRASSGRAVVIGSKRACALAGS